MNAPPYVMVVDDDEELRQGVCELLEEDGFRTVSAESGASALRRLRASSERPDVILLDLMMPVMNGWQFREEQLRDPELRSIPVVVMTASRDVQGIDANEVVFKPFNLDKLVSTVRQHAHVSDDASEEGRTEAGETGASVDARVFNDVGSGMSVPRSLITGSVRAESETAGSVFTVRIPQRMVHASGEAAPAQADPRLERELVRLRTEARARSREFETLLAQIPAPIAVLGGGFAFEMANERFRALWNCDDLVGRSLFDCSPDPSFRGLEQALRGVFETGEPFVATEVRFAGEHGESFWNITYAPVEDSRGRADRLIVFCADVTDLVLARRGAERSEENLHRIVTQVDAGIARTDLRGRFTLVNERYRAIVDRSEDELHQARVHDITHPDDLGATAERFEAMLQDGVPFTLEKRYVKPDGGIVWVQDSISRLHDGTGCPIGATVVTVDITQRKFAEWALRQSEERFRQIFETAEVSLWEEDLTALERYVAELFGVHGAELGRVLAEQPDLLDRAIDLVRTVDVNPPTLRMFEATAKSQLLDSPRAVFVPQTAPAFAALVLAIAKGQRVFASETVVRTFSGKLLDVVVTVGLPAGRDWHRVLVTMVDISAQKQVEREREARVADMERALRFSEMFVGILGHDLRNPLSAIRTWANLLEARDDSEEIGKPAARIAASAARMDRMIAQLLDFTRIRLGRGLPLERVPLDLAEQCRAIVEELWPVYEREIRFDVVGDSRGTWDRDRVAQLLSNLIANACQHGTPATPVEIRIDGSAPSLVAFEIHNSGGISPTLLPVIFEPLSRSGERREKRARSSGLGLGLYITQQVIVAHGGSIAVESSERDGTRFVVRLPRHPSDVGAGVFDAGGAPSPRGSA